MADRTNRNFLADISHEIRTPMNAVIGMTELTLQTELTSEQREYLTLAARSAESLMRLLNDALDFARTETGELEWEPTPFRLRDMVADAVQAVALQASEKKLELACRLDPAAPDTLKGDSGRLRQIIVNLVDNAVKFTDCGEVYVDVSCRQREDGRIVLSVSVRDTGIGIGPDLRRCIAEVFEQRDMPMNRRFSHTGLGLAMCSKLVHMMEGTIAVESTPGKGSTFTIAVPLEAAPGAGRKQEDRVDLTGLRVLAVDDSDISRNVLAEMLSAWNVTPTLAVNGQTALECMRQAADRDRPFHLIVLDAQMPGMDGLDVARTLRQDARFAKTAAILLSAAGHLCSPAELRSHGIARMLTKPARHDALLDAILDTVKPDALTPRPARARYSPYTPPERYLHVLVAEDELVSRKLITALLTGRGHAVTVVENGRDAINMLRGQTFDAVMMDAQMPVTDGLEATRLIREEERLSGRHTPIIAMTAYAMEGDRERMLAAGMDGYVAKPIRREELFAVLENIALDGEQADTPDSKEGASERPLQTFDAQKLLDNVEGDIELANALAEALMNQYPGLLQTLRRALQQRDSEQTAAMAHKLKGMAASFFAERALETAAELEATASKGDLEQAGRLYSRLALHLDRLSQHVCAFLARQEETTTEPDT